MYRQTESPFNHASQPACQCGTITFGSCQDASTAMAQTVEAAQSSTHSQSTDASDEAVTKATNNTLNSCASVREAKMCSHALALKHCPESCAHTEAHRDHKVTAAGKSSVTIPTCTSTCWNGCNGQSCCAYKTSQETCTSPTTIYNPVDGTGSVDCTWAASNASFQATAFRWAVVPAQAQNVRLEPQHRPLCWP